MKRSRVIYVQLALFLLTACSTSNPQKVTLSNGLESDSQNQSMDQNLAVVEAAAKTPPTPEKTKALMGEVGRNWLYGQGVGETALNVGTIVIFPPFAIVVAANLGLSLAGYQPLSISKALPEPAADAWSTTYDQVTCAPGQVAAAIAGEEFRNQHRSLEQINQVLKQ